jgi:D-serine deaminase-like pyridoxal phosphate-dependent protein
VAPASPAVGSEVGALETPVAVIDLGVLERNIAELASYSKSHGIALTPHAKTHKSLAIASRQIAAGAAALTVAKPGEAEVFSALGVPILAHYPPVGAARAHRLAAVAARVPLTVALDSTAAADMLAAALGRAGGVAEVLVELDVGVNRTGVRSVDEAIVIAEHVDNCAHIELAGISCYPGHVEEGPHLSRELSAVNETLTECRSRFEAKGLRVARISGGSTPTALSAHETIMTEMRPGTYVFLDRAEVADDALDRCALRVLTTVVSRDGHQFVLDAGSKTLSDARARTRPGWGTILNAQTWEVAELHEEHAVCVAGDRGQAPQVGERLEVIPNHACTCVNLHDQLVGVRDGVVEEIFKVDARGCVR